MVAFTLAIKLILMNFIGIFIRKSGTVSSVFSGQLTNMLMKFCIPCLIFYSIANATEFSFAELKNCAVVIILGAVAIGLGLLIGQVCYLVNRKSGLGRIMRYGLTFTHFSFMGIPVMAALFGDIGTFYYSFFLVPVRIFYYALSEKLMTPAETTHFKKSVGHFVKNVLLTPQLIAVFLGLVFWVTGLQLPSVIDYCVKNLNSISSPLALLLCGIIIGDYDFKKLLHLEYLWLPLLRGLIAPAAFFGIAKLLLLFGVAEMPCQMFVIFAALPASSLMPVYAVKYDPNPENHLRAAGSGVISVLFSALSIPLWFALL